MHVCLDWLVAFCSYYQCPGSTQRQAVPYSRHDAFDQMVPNVKSLMMRLLWVDGRQRALLKVPELLVGMRPDLN